MQILPFVYLLICGSVDDDDDDDLHWRYKSSLASLSVAESSVGVSDV